MDEETLRLLSQYKVSRDPAGKLVVVKPDGSLSTSEIDAGPNVVTTDTTSTSKLSKPVFLNDSESAALRKSAQAFTGGLPPVQEMDSELSEWKQALDAYATKKSGMVNHEAWAPILKFADILSGGKHNLVSMAPKVSSKDDRELQALKMYGDVLGQRGKLAKLYTDGARVITNSGGNQATEVTKVDETPPPPPQVKVTPPPRASKTPQQLEQAEVEKFFKAAGNPEELLTIAGQVKDLLPKTKDLGEENAEGIARRGGAGVVNKIVPGAGNYFLSPEQKQDQLRMNQISKLLAQLQVKALEGGRSSDQDYARIAQIAGAAEAGTKEERVNAINEILDIMQAKLKQASIIYPAGSAAAFKRGFASPKRVGESKTTYEDARFKGGKKAPKKDRSKMTIEELEAEAKARGIQ